MRNKQNRDMRTKAILHDAKLFGLNWVDWLAVTVIHASTVYVCLITCPDFYISDWLKQESTIVSGNVWSTATLWIMWLYMIV